tara:strand:- start:9 stop:398 length:390 start_codon:yes stop_codon:yes gene_type:complete
MRSLKETIRKKALREPDSYDLATLENVRDFWEFDDYFTAPLNGFADAEDYYRKCSSRFFLRGVSIPSLILNAKNDSFLGADCYPIEESRDSRSVYLEMPSEGEHVGFPMGGGRYFSEERTAEFLKEFVG